MILGNHIFDPDLFEEYLFENKKIAISSIKLYKGAVVKFLKSNPNIYNVVNYNQFLIDMTVRKRCTHYYFALKLYIDFKISDVKLRNEIKKQLIKPTERNDIKYERKYIEEERLIDLLNYLKNPKHKIIGIIQLFTGVRAGDILSLTRDNIIPEVYKDKNVLRINITGKGKKRNVIYIYDVIAQNLIWNYIVENINFDNYYFLELSKWKGRQQNKNDINKLITMNYQWYWRDLKEALQMVGIDKKDFATHDFRRCYSRRVWEKYKDIWVLKNLLNHANVETTMKYLKHSGMQNIDYHYEMQQ